jgi:tryptophanyl-tRNA synthetase
MNDIKTNYDNLDIQGLKNELLKLNKLKYDYLKGDIRLGEFKQERLDYLEDIIRLLDNRIEILRNKKLKYLLEYNNFNLYLYYENNKSRSIRKPLQ